MKSVWRSRVVQGGLALALVSTAAVAQHNRYFERVWFQYDQAPGARTGDYQVDIEGRPIADEHDVSALSFDPARNTLVSVTNQRPHFLELSLEGELLRRIPLEGFKDPEAIE